MVQAGLMSFEDAPPSRWRLVSVRINDNPKVIKLERASHTATVVDGDIYVIAGRRGSTFYGDLLCFDPGADTWSVLSRAIPNGFRPRANHTATLVNGHQIWILAGSDNETVIDDVHVYDVRTRTWSKPQLRGEPTLLRRTAHSAELHPCNPRAILVFGGYDGSDFRNDMCVIDTDRLTVEQVALGAGGALPPVPRGYHSCTAIGGRCYVYGGRTENGVVDASQMLVVFDAVSSRWVVPQVTGTWPQPRSSHRAVALGNRLLIHGGAAAGDQSDRLADVHSLLVCPSTGLLTWSRGDEPPPSPGSPSGNRPQGRSAHTVSLVGRDALYFICGYVGAHSGPHRYSCDVYQMQLGVPACAPPPPLPPPQPSPRRSPPHQPRPSPHQPTRQGRESPRVSARESTAHLAGAGAFATAAPAAAAAGGAAGASTCSTKPVTPLHSNPAADADVEAAPRASKRRIAPVDAAAGAPPQPGGEAAATTPLQAHMGTGAGAGGEDDPIDLTAEQPPAVYPPKAAAQATRRTPQGQRARGVAAAAGTGVDPSAPPEGAWLGVRRGRGNTTLLQQQQQPQQQQQQQQQQQTVHEPGAAAGLRGAGPATAGVQGQRPPAQTVGSAPGETATDGRAAKRQASDAAVAAAAAATAAAPAAAPPPLQPPQRGRLPVQTLTAAGQAAVPPPAAAASAVHPGTLPAPQPPVMTGTLPSGHAHVPMGWQAQAETIAAAVTAVATAAVAATTGAGPASAHAGYHHRPPSPPHMGLAGSSQEALLTQLLQDNQSLRRQLQEAQDGERQANHNLTAHQEQHRRVTEELSTQRRQCEMTQTALRTATTELEEARSQLEQLHGELAAARQQAAALQQQQAAAAHQAAERERTLLQERTTLLQQQAEEARKLQEQVKSLEAQCSRHQADADKSRRELRAEVERHGEEVAALGERVSKREQDVAELNNRLREAAAQNQKLQQELGRLQDLKQRLERDISEAREAQQRLQRQMDEQIADVSRQRDALQMQLTHANTRLAALESELRRAKDDLSHRDAQHAALLQASADKTAELAAVREQLRAAQQKYEVVRQQAGMLLTQLQGVQATVQAMANGS